MNLCQVGRHPPPLSHSPVTPPPPLLPTPPLRPRLSLLNYVAPSQSPTASSSQRTLCSPLHSPSQSAANAPNSFGVLEVRVTPPSSPEDECGPKTPIIPEASTTIIDTQPVSYDEPPPQGILFKWPWGLGSNFSSDPQTGSGAGSRSSSPQQRPSPQGLSPLQFTSASLNTGSPQTPSGTVSPIINIGADTDQLYNAFVKQWCFAQSPQPGSGYNGFPEGVLVG